MVSSVPQKDQRIVGEQAVGPHPLKKNPVPAAQHLEQVTPVREGAWRT